jgi:hypothetical protein
MKTRYFTAPVTLFHLKTGSNDTLVSVLSGYINTGSNVWSVVRITRVSDSWTATVSIPDGPADPNQNGELLQVIMPPPKKAIMPNKQPTKSVRFMLVLPYI